MDHIVNVKRRHEVDLLAQENVNMVAVTERNGEPVIRVGVSDGVIPRTAPSKLEGYHVEYDTVEPFELVGLKNRELATSPSEHQSKHRPVPGGVSAINSDSTACTSGFVLRDDSGKDFLSSNNHCFALLNEADIGDPIWQPSPYDGGTSGDMIGTLADYVPIDFGGNTKVDVAWCDPSEANISTDLFGIGELDGWLQSPKVGDELVKTGRTTGVTRGNVESLDATAEVGVGGGRSVTFTELIETTVPVQGGDSGSPTVWIDDDGIVHPIGLVFASGRTTLHIDGKNIESESGLSIVTESSFHPSDMVVSGCSTDFNKYGPGDDLTVNITVENTNDESEGAFELLVTMNGNILGNIQDSLGSGQSQTYSVEGAAPNSLGTHDINYEFTQVGPALRHLRDRPLAL